MRRRDSQEKQSNAGGGRPQTSAVVGGGVGIGGMAGATGKNSKGSRGGHLPKPMESVSEDKEDEGSFSGGNEEEEVDDFFGDLIKEFNEVKEKLADTVDPNEARFNDLKDLIQDIKTNQVKRPYSSLRPTPYSSPTSARSASSISTYMAHDVGHQLDPFMPWTRKTQRPRPCLGSRSSKARLDAPKHDSCHAFSSAPPFSARTAEHELTTADFPLRRPARRRISRL